MTFISLLLSYIRFNPFICLPKNLYLCVCLCDLPYELFASDRHNSLRFKHVMTYLIIPTKKKKFFFWLNSTSVKKTRFFFLYFSKMHCLAYTNYLLSCLNII